MSGGHFNGQEYAVKDLANEVAMCLGRMEHTEDYISVEEVKDSVIEYTRKLCDDLKRSYRALRQLDYYVSGDTCEETFIDEMKTIYGDKP